MLPTYNVWYTQIIALRTHHVGTYIPFASYTVCMWGQCTVCTYSLLYICTVCTFAIHTYVQCVHLLYIHMYSVYICYTYICTVCTFAIHTYVECRVRTFIVVHTCCTQLTRVQLATCVYERLEQHSLSRAERA